MRLDPFLDKLKKEDEEETSKKEMVNSFFERFCRLLNKDCEFLIKEYLEICSELEGHAKISEKFSVPPLVDWYQKRQKSILEQIEKNVNDNNQLIKKSVAIHERLSSDSELSEEDKLTISFIRAYYELTIRPIKFLSKYNCETICRLIEFEQSIISRNQSFLRQKHEYFIGEYVSMIQANATIFSDSLFDKIKQKGFNFSKKFRNLTDKESSEINELKEQCHRYFKKMLEKHEKLRNDVDPFPKELKELHAKVSSLHVQSNKDGDKFQEFAKSIVDGSVKSHSLTPLLIEYHKLRLLYEEKIKMIKYWIQSVIELIDKIGDDIELILSNRWEFTKFTTSCQERLVKQEKHISSKGFPDEIEREALYLLLGSNDLTEDENQHGFNECLRLTAITNGEECSARELELREMILKFSPSIVVDYDALPNGFPKELLLVSTGSD
jgi:hypothetical protein